MKVAHSISRHGKAILLISALLIVPAYLGMKATIVDFDILNYLPQKLDSMKGAQLLDKEFGNASTGFLIVERKSSREIQDLKDKIAKIPGIKAIVGIDDVIDSSIPREILPDQLRETVYSGEGTLLLVQYTGPTASKETAAATRQLRALLDKDCYLAGASAGNVDNRDASAKEAPLYLAFAIVSLGLILGLGMESWLIPVIFLAEIGLAILYNMGSNIIFGKISFLTQALAAVLQLGVTMDFSIFLLHRYDTERKRFADKRDAMAEAIRKTFLTISSGSLTEIAGFLSLCVMELTIGADIGIVMAKGVLIGVIGTMTVLPSMILVFDGPIHRFSHKPLLPSFKKSGRFVTRFALLLCVAFALCYIPAIYTRMHTEEDYSVASGLPDTVPSVAAGKKLQQDFKLTTTHMIIVRDDLPAATIRNMLTAIGEVPGITNVLAIERFVGALIPEEFLPESIRSTFEKGGKELVIVTSAYRNNSPEAIKSLDDLIAIVKQHDPDGIVTGEGALGKDLIDVAARDFKRVDMVSIGVIFIIILILFSSLSLPVVLVGCIELAIFINIGLSFVLGQKINFISTIVIGCVQLGVTIDYAILLVTRFKEELRKGLPNKEAMRTAFEACAPSIVTSAFALFFATEGVTLLSQQAILQSICGLIARGALVSMVVILVFLPALLVAFERPINATSLNWRVPFGRKTECLDKERDFQ